MTRDWTVGSIPSLFKALRVDEVEEGEDVDAEDDEEDRNAGFRLGVVS